MDVSVIIINYNTFDLTCKSIRSVLTKTAGCSFEIIVVDNGSSEKDPAEFLEHFPEIKLVRNTRNAGFAKGNNQGIEKCQGEYVLLLNSDAELVNNAILICLQKIKRERRTGVVGCKLFFPDGRIQHNCQRFPSLRYKLFELLRLQKLLPSRLGAKVLLGSFFNHDVPVYPDWIWGTFFMFRKDLLRLLPGSRLPEDFFMYFEDMQWCWEFRKRGFRVAFEPLAEVLHHMGQSSGNKSALMKANADVFMNRYYSRFGQMLIAKIDQWLL